jgi:hypothetical protein
MTMTSQARRRLDDLGDALHAATTAELVAEQTRPRAIAGVPITAHRNRRRTLALALVATAIALPGAALAANALITNGDVADGIPASTWALVGTHPRCTTIRANVEFDCVLASLPREGDIPAGAWKGTVEPTVDLGKHVNGGCRSLNADGTHWRCYLGEEAVRQHTVGAEFLGELSSGPARG